MPQPTLSDVHVDRPLTNISIAFMQDAMGYVADKIFPVVPVSKQSDKYFTYDRRDWKRVEVKERAPASESAGSGFRVDSTASYSARVRAVHKDVDEQIRMNSDDPINADRDATQWVTAQLLLDREVQWASRFFTSGVWGTDFTPGTLWNVSTSTPIEDVATGVITLASATGYRPNVFVMSPRVWRALKNHPDILDRIKYTEKGIVTTDLLAALFDVEKVLVAWGVQDSSAEGAAAELSDFVMGKHALLAYANPSPGILQPSAGYIFGWTGLLGAGAYAGPRISRIPVPLTKSDRIEGEMAYDQKVVAASLGYFFANTVA
jgi:hypothetical protein